MSLLNRKYSYFVGNIYAIVKRNSFTKLSFSFSLLKHRNVWVFWNKKKIGLLNYPLVLSLLKYRNVWVFWNKKKKKSGSNRCSPLNSSIDKEKHSLKNKIPGDFAQVVKYTHKCSNKLLSIGFMDAI